MVQDGPHGLVALEESAKGPHRVYEVVHPVEHGLFAWIGTLAGGNLEFSLLQLPHGVRHGLLHYVRGYEVQCQQIHCGHQEEHLHGREIRGLPPLQVVADHVTRAIEEVPKRAWQTAVA